MRDPVVRSHDENAGFPSPDKVRRHTRNADAAKQRQHHSLDDVDGPWSKLSGHIDGDPTGKSSAHSRNNREELTFPSREPRDTGAAYTKRSNPLPVSTEETRRSRDDLVAISGLNGGRPSLSRNDSKNQDIINWLGITSSNSADVGTEFNYENDISPGVRPMDQSQPVGRSYPSTAPQFRLDTYSGRQNTARNAENFPPSLTMQDIHPSVDQRKGLGRGVTNPLYDISRREWGSDNSLSTSSSPVGKEERRVIPRLQEPTSSTYQPAGQDRRVQDGKTDSQSHPGLRVADLGAEKNLGYGYVGKQNYNLSWAQGSLNAEGLSGYPGEQPAGNARPQLKPAHSLVQPYQQSASLQGVTSDLPNFDERPESGAASKSKQDMSSDIDNGQLFPSGRNHAMTDHNWQLDMTSNRLQHLHVEDARSGGAGAAAKRLTDYSTECEYAVVQKRKDPTESSVNTNAQNNNTQDQVNLEGLKNAADLVIRAQQPPATNVDPASVPNDRLHSALRNDPETQQQVDAAPVRPPLPAVDMLWDSGRNFQQEPRDTAADDWNRMVFFLNVSFVIVQIFGHGKNVEY